MPEHGDPTSAKEAILEQLIEIDQNPRPYAEWSFNAAQELFDGDIIAGWVWTGMLGTAARAEGWQSLYVRKARAAADKYRVEPRFAQLDRLWREAQHLFAHRATDPESLDPRTSHILNGCPV